MPPERSQGDKTEFSRMPATAAGDQATRQELLSVELYKNRALPLSEDGIHLNEGYPPTTLKLAVLSGPTVKHKPLPQEQATHRGAD